MAMAVPDVPTASVVIPTLNRPEALSRCLDALARARGPSFEVIVVDDGSPRPVHDVVRRFTGCLDVQYLRQRRAGPARARNLGVSAARGEVLCFTDDDCLPQPDWVLEMVTAVAGMPDALVGGRTVNLFENNIYSEASQDLVSFLYADGQSGAFRFFAANNLGCSRRRFVSMGGFDETFRFAAGEDRFLGARWTSRGWPLKYLPAAVVLHAHWLDLRSFWRQHANYGRGARHLRRRLAEISGRVHGFEHPRFYRDLVTYPMRMRRRRWLRRVALLGIAQVANLAGFVDETLRVRSPRQL